jgi:hypothetical protein
MANQHNHLFQFLWAKNTISCGAGKGLTKPVGPGKTKAGNVFRSNRGGYSGQLRLDVARLMTTRRAGLFQSFLRRAETPRNHWPGGIGQALLDSAEACRKEFAATNYLRNNYVCLNQRVSVHCVRYG